MRLWVVLRFTSGITEFYEQSGASGIQHLRLSLLIRVPPLGRGASIKIGLSVATIQRLH
ncbi:hypothetical protein BN874_990022 [Candidatus Contendobacter odensis Run_B_J11]|uniref:Uncharacterized protein n=1 Tax=Candidatus Contendobacter odensis Run_B_J11 TaxID=1400861 RepID=A0A7U7GG75_9GAMM|nr:hypothetical protein BN874_990022 [Candidatus Contendobacter odensis Run_B_J11]